MKCALRSPPRVVWRPGSSGWLVALLPSPGKDISHDQRCAAITRDMCDLLLGEELPYRGCLSSVAAFILEKGEGPAGALVGPFQSFWEL